MDKLIGSSGDKLTGNVALMANVAGGEASASHTIISSFDSRAEREVWFQALVASPAWTEFIQATSGILERHGNSRMNFVKSWGEENDEDVFWEIYAFTVTDLDGFSGAIDVLLASDTGKKFPGQVHLSEVAAAGMSPVTHLISVGFESEAQAEAWGDLMVTSKDWASYQEAAGKVSTFAGAYMIRTIKTWSSSGD